MSTENEIQIIKPEQNTQLSVEQVKGRLQLIQDVMREVMKEGNQYGIIPGCGKKKVLFKSGAEILATTFKLAPTFKIQKENLDNGHREYIVTTTITNLESGKIHGEGVGSCSTLENKYRYRDEKTIEFTDKSVPKAYWDAKKAGDIEKAQNLLGGNGFIAKKNNNDQWVIAKKLDTGAKKENPDIASEYNTVLKMAKKRSFVDAMLTVTGVSDIFTQDLEEKSMEDIEMDEPKQKKTPFETIIATFDECKTKEKAKTLVNSFRNQLTEPQMQELRNRFNVKFGDIQQ